VDFTEVVQRRHMVREFRPARPQIPPPPGPGRHPLRPLV